MKNEDGRPADAPSRRSHVVIATRPPGRRTRATSRSSPSLPATSQRRRCTPRRPLPRPAARYRRAHRAPPAPVTPGAAQGPGRPGACGHCLAFGPGPAVPRRPPPQPPPATPWPPGRPPRGPRPGSRHVPGPGPQPPSAAAAAAHPDAGRPPRISPPAAPRSHPPCLRHTTTQREDRRTHELFTDKPKRHWAVIRLGPRSLRPDPPGDIRGH